MKRKTTGNVKRNTSGTMNRKTSGGLWVLTAVIVLIFIFSYLSMNLKSVDYGYEMQELFQHERVLKEEINILRAEKASLLNLERVEDIVIHKLGYQYPESGQFIKVFE
jgi:cell division protein FtsL